MRVHFVVFSALIAVCGTLPLSAHHSVIANFDTANPVTLSGVITKVNLQNPHTTLELTSKDANGKATTWIVEMAPPSALRRTIDVSSLSIGSSVTVGVWLAKSGEKLATCRSLTTSDGKTIIDTGTQPPVMDWATPSTDKPEYRGVNPH